MQDISWIEMDMKEAGTMPRKKKNPNYNSEQVMKDLLEAVVELYNSGMSLSKIADELDLDWQKVRKLLCTASYRKMCDYDSKIAGEVLQYYKEQKSVADIMNLTGLSKSSVQSYLPYTKVPYKESEISANAERLRVFRERQKAVKDLKEAPVKGLEENPDILWGTIKHFENYPFKTVNGLKFKYEINGGEMIIDRKKRTDRKKRAITRRTVETAYNKAETCDITSPRQLGVSGASYLFPIFVRLGAIPDPNKPMDSIKPPEPSKSLDPIKPLDPTSERSDPVTE